jgi:cephalosporin-C deacetylase-like acetyl esterase
LQTRDYTAAINFAINLPSVHPKRIVLWGGGLAGGNAIVAAAIDKRAKALISLVPMVSGELISQALGPMVNFILADNVEVTKGNPSQMFCVHDTVADCWGVTTGFAPYLAECERRGVTWEAYATTQSMFHLQMHDPSAFMHRVKAPVLMIVAENDAVSPVDMQIEMLEKAGKQKQLYTAKGRAQFDIYYGNGLEEVMKVQLEFLKRVFP